jgi:hypothetical protein
METLIALAAFAAVGCIMAATFLYIRQWGPGIVTRRIRCPEKKERADVTFVQKEGDFGSLNVVDVIKCSLLPDGPITCEKACRKV